jgi:hypothetical protein
VAAKGYGSKGRNHKKPKRRKNSLRCLLCLLWFLPLFLWGFKLQTGDLFRRHQGDARDLESQREKERSLAQISIDVSPIGLTCRARERLRKAIGEDDEKDDKA